MRLRDPERKKVLRDVAEALRPVLEELGEDRGWECARRVLSAGADAAASGPKGNGDRSATVLSAARAALPITAAAKNVSTPRVVRGLSLSAASDSSVVR